MCLPTSGAPQSEEGPPVAARGLFGRRARILAWSRPADIVDTGSAPSQPPMEVPREENVSRCRVGDDSYHRRSNLFQLGRGGRDAAGAGRSNGRALDTASGAGCTARATRLREGGAE
jgi:hypothetical protein